MNLMPKPTDRINVQDYGALGRDDIVTTGSITTGTNTLVVADPNGIVVGCYLTIDGAGPNSSTLYDAQVTWVDGSTVELSIYAATTVSGATVQTDDLPAFVAALNAMNHALVPSPSYIGAYQPGTTLYVPPGPLGDAVWGFKAYRMSRTLRINRKITMVGASISSTILKFDEGQTGLFIESNDNSPEGGSGNLSIIREMTLRGGEQFSTPPSLAGGDYYLVWDPSLSGDLGTTIVPTTYFKNLSGRAWQAVVAGTPRSTEPDFSDPTVTYGAIAAASNLLTVDSATGFSIGQSITVQGAGYDPGNVLVATISSISGSVLTLSTNAILTVAAAAVQVAVVDGNVTWNQIDCAGVFFQGKALVENLFIYGFAGNGIQIVASAPTAGNANNAQIRQSNVQLCGGNGVYIHGNDASQATIIGTEVDQCNGWGFVDDSFLGNAWLGVEADDNLRGSFWMTHGEIYRGYAEGGQGPIYLGGSASWIDGFSTEGFTGLQAPIPVLTWSPSTTYVPPVLVQPTVANGYYYVLVNQPSGGTSGGTEPTWPAARCYTVSDNGMTWTAYEYTDLSTGYFRNGAQTGQQYWVNIANNPSGIVPSTFNAVRYPDEALYWNFGVDGVNGFSLNTDFHGTGWQAITWNRNGPPTPSQPVAFATARAVSSYPSAAQFAGQLMIPYPFLIGSIYGNVIHMGSDVAAPTTNAWLQGSIIWNAAFALGQPIGWICTVAGTPGTWVPIDAKAVAYSASTPGDWAGGSPATNIGDALDRIAAALTTLGQSP